MYVKTQWVDNTTPIDKTNLNKIEQGIYDNSLVADAVTNKLNPTDTETYKTAELTEGQITDVIGVSDIVIKGQTSQNGEPTPSSPVDINVVSGSNVINTSNKNLLSFLNIEKTVNGITYKFSNEILKLSGTVTTSTAINSPIFNLAAGTYMFTSNISGILEGPWQTYIRDVTTGDSPLVTGSGSFTITETKQVQFRLYMNSGVNGTDITFYPMLEVGSTATDYERHQGKKLPLDLDPIELCKIGNYQDYFYKRGSKWYLHKEIGKIKVNGSEQWEFSGNIDNNISYQLRLQTNLEHTTNDIHYKAISTHFSYSELSLYKTTDISLSGLFTLLRSGTNFNLRIVKEGILTVADLKTWLASNNVLMYYVLVTATDTEITDTTLISQLEAIYNAPLYEQTNITQTNNDLPMILDITACKDNINGIKAFIRK